MTNLEKQSIFEEAKEIFLKNYGIKKMQDGACVYWAVVAYQLLKLKGFEVAFQAGDLNWPIMPPELDDGIAPTHFSFMWSPNDLNSIMSMLSGGIPEMHVWIYDLIHDEIIDFSTNGLRKTAERMKFKWKTPNPPDFLWGDIPENVFYNSRPGACHYLGNRILPLHQK